MKLPPLYPIIDAELLAAHSIQLSAFARELLAAGVSMIQYRNKQGSPRQILKDAGQIRAIFQGCVATLILNDRADLALLSEFDGVHVGQQDMPPADARRIVGSSRMVGVSTHTLDQVIAANATDCDYIAYGPIFATATKANPDPVVGIKGLQAARALTHKPLVAIGGITCANCRSVVGAGADTVAVVSALLPVTRLSTTCDIAKEFLALAS